MERTRRVNLLLDNPAGIRNDWLNIDPFGNDKKRVVGDPFNLTSLVDVGELEELAAHDILGFAPGAQVDQVLNHWLSLLKPQGLLTFSVVDVRAVARSFLNGQLDIDAVDSLLYGAQRAPWELRKSALTLDVLVQVLEQKPSKILKKRVENHFAIITCMRTV